MCGCGHTWHRACRGTVARADMPGADVERRVLLVQNNSPELLLSFFGAMAVGAVATGAVPWASAELLRHFLQ